MDTNNLRFYMKLQICIANEIFRFMNQLASDARFIRKHMIAVRCFRKRS